MGTSAWKWWEFSWLVWVKSFGDWFLCGFFSSTSRSSVKLYLKKGGGFIPIFGGKDFVGDIDSIAMIGSMFIWLFSHPNNDVE